MSALLVMAPILIVDDDATIREMFSRALASLGEIEVASNGGDALRMLGGRKYSAVVLDLHMPVVDGFMVLHAVATKPGPNRQTPVLVVTADLSDSARVKALGKHAVFLLTKPVSLGTLKALVENALHRSDAKESATAKKPGLPVAPPPSPSRKPPA